MAILKCKMCGGDMILNEEKTFGTCEYCGSTMTLPKVSDDQRAALFNRGNHFRRSGEFDKALAIYENIVREDDTDAEAHWCCALCRFGIEYVEDPDTFEFVPTCHRASFDSILNDVDYLAALENSDGITRRQYQKDAAKIAEVQKGILATSQNEEPFDVFICYKETDDTTKERTKDSIDAQEIYYQLTNEGYRVFFSRITLENKAGAEYEPYIFAALNSAKVMVVVGSKPEYFSAIWVKNEWSRYLAMMRKDRSKLLLPCYKNMDPYDLPEQLSVLQSYDMTKIGFIQDLIRGIKKVINKNEPESSVKETVVIENNNANTAPLLERAFLFLEDGKWQDANIYCEKVLDIAPKNAEAYLGKLMAELQVRTRKQLADCAEPFDGRENFGKVLRFGDDKLESEMRGYIEQIKERKAYESEEQIKKNEKARMRSQAVMCALKDGLKTKHEPTTSEKLVAANTSVRYLENILSIFGSTQERIQAIQNELKDVISQEDQLVEQRSRLGIFAGKEKKRIDEELLSITTRKNNLVVQIDQQQNKIGGYDSAEAVEHDLNDERKNVEDLKAQIENTPTTADKKYSFKEALDIYLNEPDTAAFINDIYPAAVFIPVMLGKSGTVKFGRYVQKEHGQPEPIEWQVLERCEKRILVISKYALDCQQFNHFHSSVVWETCSLRKWLNDSFLNAAFNSDEQNSIIDNKEDSFYADLTKAQTYDKIFLLSKSEVNEYFISDNERQCQGTEYCYAQGAYKAGNGNCPWWLRSTPFHNAAAIACNGSGISFEVNVATGVRPAMWISL